MAYKITFTQYKSDTDPAQNRYWPSAKVILTRYKSDTYPVQKRYRLIPFLVPLHKVCVPAVPEPVTSLVLVFWYRNVYQNSVQDMYQKVLYRYLVPYKTMPDRYRLPPLNSTGMGTDRFWNVYWESTLTQCPVYRRQRANTFICHIMNLIWLLSDKGTRVCFYWIPSHCGMKESTK